MSCGPDHQRFLVLSTQRGDFRRRGVRAEVDNDVTFFNHAAQIVALIDLTRDLNLGELGRARDEGPPHASFRPGYDYLSHSRWFGIRAFLGGRARYTGSPCRTLTSEARRLSSSSAASRGFLGSSEPAASDILQRFRPSLPARLSRERGLFR